MKKLGFGLMRLPMIDNDQSNIDLEQFKEMVDIFISKGFTYFDTAYVYHKEKSEEAFKEAVVKRYPREAYTITDKLPTFKIKEKEDNEKYFSEQLNRLGLDYVDYYWMHALNLERFNEIKKHGTLEFMQEVKKQGRAKHIGFSFHDTAENLDKILSEIHEWIEFVQLQINYLDWESDNVESRKCYEVCKKYNKSVIVMEPVKGGTLANLSDNAQKVFTDIHPNMSNASWAIRYAASLDNVYMVLSGMSNLAQLNDNVSYMENFKPLNNEENEAIKKVLHILETEQKIKCTGCRYCTDTCPKKIAIPDYFKVYNNVHKSYADYKNIINSGSGKPDECIKCGICESLCPQKLEIRKYLEDVAKEI